LFYCTSDANTKAQLISAHYDKLHKPAAQLRQDTEIKLYIKNINYVSKITKIIK